VQDARPLRPRVGLVALGEVVRVDGQSDRRVVMCEPVQRADELAVTGRHVQSMYVLVMVVWVQPVRVLKLNTTHGRPHTHTHTLLNCATL